MRINVVSCVTGQRLVVVMSPEEATSIIASLADRFDGEGIIEIPEEDVVDKLVHLLESGMQEIEEVFEVDTLASDN